MALHSFSTLIFTLAILTEVLLALSLASNPYGYALYAVNRSLEKAKSTTDLLIEAGASTGKVKASAIDACLELAEMSIDDLETAFTELSRWESALTTEGVNRVRMRMSGAMTNADTCLDGLEEETSTSSQGIYEIMHEASKTYGVTLTLVDRAMDTVERKWLTRSAAKTTPATKIGAGVLLSIIDTIPANQTVIVARNRTRNFSTIADAINSAPFNINDGYYMIIIKKGIYQENVMIPPNKTRLIIVGAGINQTVITANRSWADGWETYYTATFAVHGEGFIACNLTFENTAGPEKYQAVAVRNDADYSVFYKCSFLGYQDTLYVHRLRQFYRDCDIYGTIDFIFGNAAAVFQNCRIYARRPLQNQNNTITAQGRKYPNEKTGISIHNCSILASPDLDMNSVNTYLGRPWKIYSRTVFMQSYIGSHISLKGWLEWNGTVGLDTLYYGEYENYGPGNCPNCRVKLMGYRRMNVSEADNFTVDKFIYGESWLQNTSIPFIPGLL